MQNVKYILHLYKDRFQFFSLNTCEMNNILLPYYFKKIGLLLFLVGFVPAFGIGFVEGFIDGFTGNTGDRINIPISLESIFAAISYVGIVCYFLAKEKIFDELFQQMRADAINTTFVLSALVMTIISIGRFDVKWAVDSVILLQMAVFLIIFYFKRRSNMPKED